MSDVKAVTEEVCFIVSADAEEEARHFRIMEAEHSHTPTEETSTIIFSASSQYSEKGFRGIHDLAREYGSLHVVNLREETSFMVNGHAITEYNGAKNDVNKGLTPEQVVQKEREYVERLKQQEQLVVKGGREKVLNHNTKRVSVEYAKEQTLAINSVRTEEECVTALGSSYSHIPITDHSPQSVPRNVDRIVQVILKAMQDGNKWIHFHCHAGKGRASLAMLVGTMMVHAKTKSLAEIEVSILSQEKYQLEKRKYERFKLFFEHFYTYCKEADLTQKSWTEWAKEKQVLEIVFNKIPQSKDP